MPFHRPGPAVRQVQQQGIPHPLPAAAGALRSLIQVSFEARAADQLFAGHGAAQLLHSPVGHQDLAVGQEDAESGTQTVRGLLDGKRRQVPMLIAQLKAEQEQLQQYQAQQE